MANINLYFVLLNPQMVSQRIIAGDLGMEQQDWTLSRFLSEEEKDRFSSTFTALTDKVAYAPITKEWEQHGSYTELGEGWVELAVEAASMLHALMIAQRAGITLQRKRKTEQS